MSSLALLGLLAACSKGISFDDAVEEVSDAAAAAATAVDPGGDHRPQVMVGTCNPAHSITDGFFGLDVGDTAEVLLVVTPRGEAALQAIAGAWEQHRSIESVVVSADSVHATLAARVKHTSSQVDTHEHRLEVSARMSGSAITINSGLPCFQR